MVLNNNIVGIDGIDGSSIIDLTILTEEYTFLRFFYNISSSKTEAIPSNYDRDKEYIITFPANNISMANKISGEFAIQNNSNQNILILSNGLGIVMGYKFKITSDAVNFYYSNTQNGYLNLYVKN